VPLGLSKKRLVWRTAGNNIHTFERSHILLHDHSNEPS
jgi:hypothetical protein